ncbi:putative cinnamyl alcohol dehydrogenase 1 [Silene latifolia]|uniref:putative cinnamyl alcohol dehydrogenase 1 n=1 Tax=Silene latifolia TaxID=37657 RepID=UPI003D782A3F
MSSETSPANCRGWAARDPSGVLSPIEFHRRAVANDDVSIKITHCGVCYADVIWTRNVLGDCKYPVVPGHEIVGTVQEVGANVEHLKVGDDVAVGTCVNSCRDCEYCNEGNEICCVNGSVHTYNAVDKDGTITKGGYSSSIVIHQRYCFKIPKTLPKHLAAPLLCAGITVYSPMVRHNMDQPGKSLGVIGLGGLGHMAVLFGKAFGLKVTVLSTSISKKDEALNLLGADNFVLSSDEQQMKAIAKSLDFIIDTASGDHAFDPYMSLLKTFGSYVLVGFPSEVKFRTGSLLFGLNTISGSKGGGSTIIREMLEFCATNKLYPKVEIIPIQYANEAIERLIKKDVKYRFVIDIENSLN